MLGNTKSKLRIAGITTMVMMLVVSGIPIGPSGSSPVQTAEADVGSEGCVDDAGIALLSAPTVLYSNAVDPCWQADKQENQTLQGVYEDGIAMNQFKSEALTEVQNNLNGAKSAARTEAKIAFANAIKNGSSQSEAVHAGKEAARDYYSSIQNRTLTQWNTGVEELKNMRVEALSAHDVSDPINDTSTNLSEIIISYSKNSETDYVVTASDNTTYDLINGTTVSVQSITTHDSGPHTPFMKQGSDWDSANSANAFTVKVVNPANTSDTSVALDMFQFHNVTQQIQTDHSQVQSSLGDTTSGYLAETYTLVDSGMVNMSDIFSPQEWARMNMDESDIGTSTYYNTQMAYLGYGGADYQSSMEIDLSAGTQINGAELGSSKTLTDANLYTRAEPTTTVNGSPAWQTNHTYNTSNFNQTVYVTYQVTTESLDGDTVSVSTETKRATVEGEFTIELIVNTDTGESQDSAGYVNRTQETTDPSQFTEDLKDIREQISDLEDEMNTGGGGGAGVCGIQIPLGFTSICTGITSASISYMVLIGLGGITLWTLVVKQ